MSVSELLQWIEQNRKSGTLQIDTKTYWKKLYFKDGCILFASSNREREKLGQFLIRKGIMTQAALESTLAHSRRTGVKLSDAIAEMGYLTRDELVPLLEELIHEIVYDSFLDEKGDFEFREKTLPPEVLGGLTLRPQEMAMEGLRRLDEFQRDRASLPDEGLVLVAAPVSLERIEAVLGREGREMFLLVDGSSSAATVLERSPLPLHQAQPILLSLISGGAVSSRPRLEALASVQHSGAGASPADLERQVGPPETLLVARYETGSAGVYQDLDADEGFLFSRIADRCTVRELLQVSVVSRERTYELLWNLIRKGYVEARRAR